jgi:hypothetical protein
VSESPAEPTAEQLVEELRKAKVEEMIVHSGSIFASLAYGKLAPEVHDLEQARLAIDAVRALVAVLPAEQQRTLQQTVANLQLAYADAAGQPG